MFRKECFVTDNLVFRYYQLTFNINSRYQTFISKTWYFILPPSKS